MIKALNVLLGVVCLLALGGVYMLKYQSFDTGTAKAMLEAKIENQQGELSTLKADWAYLIQPSHIEPIVRRHADALQLAAVQQSQFVHIEDIPMRRPKTDIDGLTELFEALESGVDPIAALIEANP